MEPSNTTAPIFAASVMGEWSSAKTGAKPACGSTVDRLNHGMAEAQRFGSIWPLGSPPRRLFFVRSPSRRLSSSAHPAGKSLHRTPAQRSWAEPIRLSVRLSLPQGSVRYGGLSGGYRRLRRASGRHVVQSDFWARKPRRPKEEPILHFAHAQEWKSEEVGTDEAIER